MNKEKKYSPLFNYLRECGEKDITLSFAEIERMLIRPLPKSAHKNRGWWSNRRTGLSQSKAWMEAGYHVIGLSLEEKTVSFRKPTAVYNVEREDGVVMWDGPLIWTLRHHMDLSQADMAEELGVRQQTISEWETGMYRPKRSMSKYLMMIAEKAGFTYGEDQEDE